MAIEQAKHGKVTLIASIEGDVVIAPKAKWDELQEGKEPKEKPKIFTDESL